MSRVDVALGERSYPIHDRSRPARPRRRRCSRLMARDGRLFVISDENVWAAAGRACGCWRSRPSRSSCRPARAARAGPGSSALIDRLLALGVERGDHLVAFGGGVIGDLAGFAAADPQARLRLHPDPDHPARPGRFLGRRQDRDQRRRRQESGRRLPPAGRGADRPGLPRHAAARASCAPAMPRW